MIDKDHREINNSILSREVHLAKILMNSFLSLTDSNNHLEYYRQWMSSDIWANKSFKYTDGHCVLFHCLMSNRGEEDERIEFHLGILIGQSSNIFIDEIKINLQYAPSTSLSFSQMTERRRKKCKSQFHGWLS